MMNPVTWRSNRFRRRFSLSALVLFIVIVICGSCARRNEVPVRTLRIGFDNAPPYTLISADGTPRGLAVELIEEAARRRGISLQWVKFDNGKIDTDDLLARRVIDLWPVVGLAQKRLARIYIARPWLENNFFLVSRKAQPVSNAAQAKGRRVIHGTGLLATEMAQKFLGESRRLPVRGFANLIVPVCTGEADAAFMEARTLEAILLERAPDCDHVALKVSSIQGAISHAGIGANREAASAADVLTDEIIAMAADGMFARTVDKWSSFSASETRSLVALQQTHDRNTLFYRGLLALMVVCLALTGIAGFAFRARGIAERARATEASRVEILRQLARGTPLEEIVALINCSLGRCCPRLHCVVTIAIPEGSAEEVAADVIPVVDSRGLQIGAIRLPMPATGLSREESKVVDGIRQLTAIVAEHRMLHRELRRQARQDRLTGLSNRSVFAETMEQLTQTPADSQKEAAIFFFDLDRFKQVNDRFGHGAGDVYLREAAQRIANCLGPAALVARLGGDEFAAIAQGSDGAAAGKICEAVIEAFRAPFVVDGFRIMGGVSVGVSVYPHDGRNPADLQRSADAALYDAKNGGRNRFTVCSPEIRESAGSIVRAERLIRQALEQDWLEVFYQPQTAVDGELVGMEALVRIRHPHEGLISATDFIQIAEQAGLVAEIDAWVLPEVVRQYAEWSRRGLNPVRIAANISRLDLAHEDLFDRVTSSLKAYGVPPNALQIELTETAAVLGGETSVAMLRRLQQFGISLALDDFGCGYSSMSCLDTLPVDTVKIDRSFIQRLTGEHGSDCLVSAMIAAAKALRMAVVAEGIENEEQVGLLRRMGCDVLQGYHIGRPLNAEAASRALADRLSEIVPEQLEVGVA